MKRILTIILCCIGFTALADDKVDAVVSKLANEQFANSQFGCYAMYGDGEMIVGSSEHRRLNPASNMKVITTACALVKLGADFKWSTSLSYGGSVDSLGVLHGDLYIIGGGDPTLGADNNPVKGRDAAQKSFAQWKAMLDQAGIRAIDGRICADAGWMDGQRQEPSWLYEDLGTYYGVQVSGLNFFENRQNFKVRAGAKVGDELAVEVDYPVLPWMKWEYECRTGEPKSGDKLYMYQEYGTSFGVLTGTFGVDSKPKTLMCRNNYPELTVAYEFGNYLESYGISVSGDAAIVADDGGLIESLRTVGRPDADTLKVLGCTESLPLKDVAYKTNKESDNFYAEILFRTMGKQFKGTAKIAQCRTAMEEAFRSIYPAYPARELSIKDGSGLSCQNQVSPYVLCNFLSRMIGRPEYEAFVNTLVCSEQRVWLKTGSMNGCRTLCGYILPSTPGGRTIVFSIMVGHSPFGVYTIDCSERTIISALKTLN